MTKDMVLADLARCLAPEVLVRAERLLSGGGDVDAFLIEHGKTIDAAFPDRAEVLRFKLLYHVEKAIPDPLASAVAAVESYVSARDGSNTAPHAAIRTIQTMADRLPHPSRTAALLLGAAELASRVRYDDWDGQDLRNVRPVIEAMGAVAALPDRTVRFLAGALESATQSTYHAQPGSPDPDKFDRDRDAEHAQDDLALAAVTALGRFRADAALALPAIDAAMSHRDPRVASMARDVAKAIRYYAAG